MFGFKFVYCMISFLIADRVKFRIIRSIDKRKFIKNTVLSTDIAMITKDTDTSTLNSIWTIAQNTVFLSGGMKQMKNMLIRSSKIPMLTHNTDSGIYNSIFSIGKNCYSQHRGRPIWRRVFVQAIVSSHLIPCIDVGTTNDILDTIADIVEHTVTPDVAVKKLFSKLIASHVDIPMINSKTEVVVFESLFNIASSALWG
jgi:hypothetical protein